MSKRKLNSFNRSFITETIDSWVKLAKKYREDSEALYVRLRSYLTMYQYRLSDDEKCEIRENLSKKLDEIDNFDQIDNMDNFLDGFCFKLDSSIIPSMSSDIKHTNKIDESEIERKVDDESNQQRKDSYETNDLTAENDLDFYSLQFF